MDELDLLTRHRPARPSMTAAERAAIEEQLMTHIETTTRPAGAAPPEPADETPSRPSVDLGAPPRRTRRVLRRAAVVGAAAAVVVTGLLVAGGSDHAPPALRDRPATAAEELRAIAVDAAASPFPDVPYAIDVRVDVMTGRPELSEETYEQTLYQVDANTTIADGGGCVRWCFLDAMADPGVPFAPDADAAEVRAGLDRATAAWRASTREMSDGADDEDPVRLRLILAVEALMGRVAGPAARAELLRIVADSPGLTMEEGVTTALGHTGTRFTIDHQDVGRTFVVDPSDGYVLETGALAGTPIDLDEPPVAVEVDPDGTTEEVAAHGIAFAQRVTFDRPEPLNDLPAEVDQTLAAADAGWEAATAGWAMPQGRPARDCMGAGSDAEEFPGIPEGWTFMRCWTPEGRSRGNLR